MRDHAPAGVRVTLAVVAEDEGPDAQDPRQVRGPDRPQLLPPAGGDVEPVDACGHLPAAGNEQGTAVRAPPDDGVVGSRAGDGPRLAPVGRIERESASTRLDEDQPAVGGYESVTRAFRRHGAGLTASDVLHVAPDAVAVFMAAGEDPSGVREEMRGLVADEAAAFEPAGLAGAREVKQELLGCRRHAGERPFPVPRDVRGKAFS